MAVADLHVHTTNSDGTLELEEVPAAARRAEVDAVAVTDHDRLHPSLEASIVHREGITIVHGIELRVEAGDRRVDLLGYGARRTDALEREVERIQTDRVQRGRAIVECVEDRLSVDLGVKARKGLGRPHVARAIADHPETDYDYQGAFDNLLGKGRPCYVARDVPPFERGRELLTAACGLVALAHPLRYNDPESALALAAELDGVELHYPYDHEVDPRSVERAIRKHDLVATGGSDAHDDELGKAGLSSDEYRHFRNRMDQG